MALQNGGTDANGVVALNNVAGMDQYVTFGGRTLPPDEIALTTSFNSMQVAIANVSPVPPLGAPADDGANITAALAKNAPVVLQKGATYNIATPIVMSATPGATLYGNGATLTGAMARTGGIGNSVILAQPTLSGVGNTTLNGNAVIGARTLAVTAGAGIANGTFIQLQSAAGASLTSYYLVIAGGTTNTLTLDRPIQEPFLNADTVKPVSVMPRSCNVIGPLTINGNGDNALSWAGMRRGYLRDIYADVQNAASGATCLVGGLDLDVGCFAVLAEDCQATGFNLAANADEFTIGIGMASCESCRLVRCAGRHATTAGILVTNSFSCTVDHCEGTDCGGASAGIAVSGTSATAAGGSTDCVVQNSYVGDSAFGFGCALTTRTTVRGVTAVNCSTRHFDIGTGGVASTDCTFDRITALTGAVTSAAILVDAAVVRPLFSSVRVGGITGTAQCFSASCNVTVRGFVATTDNATTGNVLVCQGPGDSYVSDVNIALKGAGAATSAVTVTSTGRFFFRNCVLAFGVANDAGFTQSGGGIVELDDVVITNSLGGTSGITVSTATSVTRRKGRVDFTGAATPYTLQQADQGTLTANGAAGVTVTFRDIATTATVMFTEKTAGGTPAAGSYTITGSTSFTRTGTAGDTSVYSYKVMD